MYQKQKYQLHQNQNLKNINGNRLKSLVNKGLIDELGQTKMFRSGGLIPKFQNSGQLGRDEDIVSGQVINQNNGSYFRPMLKPVISYPKLNNNYSNYKLMPDAKRFEWNNTFRKYTLNQPLTKPSLLTKSNKVSGVSGVSNANQGDIVIPINQKSFEFDPTALTEFPKLAMNLATNARNSRIMKKYFTCINNYTK